MAYLNEEDVRARAARITQRAQKSANRVLSEAAASDRDTFDVFLSHSSAEPEEILLGIKALLEDRGLTVYVDKYGDPHLSPETVTRETAAILRTRMRQSRSLLYVYSRHSTKSRWMPWELGFFDGFKGTVGIVPVTRNQEDTFKGEEYLSLYPYVDAVPLSGTSEPVLWINRSAQAYARLEPWLKGTEQIRQRP